MPDTTDHGLDEIPVAGADTGLSGKPSPDGPTNASASEPSPQSGSDAAGRARALVLDAFAVARRTGKAGWDTMTTAVLKNRLLDLTNRMFSEGDYGARDMAAFAKSMPDLIELIPGVGIGPALVRLVDPDSVDRAAPPPPTAGSEGRPRSAARVRVRRDLWRAALDWNAVGQLVLDAGSIRPRAEGDDPALPVFTPVPESLFESWKQEFVDASLPAAQGAEAGALLAWARQPAPARTLGRSLQDRWMDALRTHVLDYLRGWFLQQGVVPPADLAYDEPEASGIQTEPDDRRQGLAAPTRRLKDFVLRCVHEMTEDELSALPIPAGVAARIRL